MKKIFFLLIAITVSMCTQAPKEFPKSKIPFNPESYVCYKADKPLVIDGKLNESLWEKTEWTNYFVDIEGDIKPRPTYKTRVKMLWDDEYFYFAAKMEEPHVWAKLTERDAVVFYDNDFEVFIDPEGDTHNYYELEINAFNTQWDLLILRPYRDENSYNVALNGWDIKGLKTAVYIDGTINDPSDKDKGWTVEIAYPWKALSEMTRKSSPPEDGDQWRVNFSRVEWETEVVDGKYEKKINPKTNKHYPENNWVWSPQGLIALHAPETWGFVQFSNNIVGSDKVEFFYNKIEDAKWAMRKIYFAEHDYKLKNGIYTNDFNQLNFNCNKNLDDYHWPPTINTSSTQFEAILKSKNGESELIIYQDGLIEERSYNDEK
ncbi:MAG: carbohydrate-binding family 9-like protein [Bacteroidota bacterium]